MASEEPETTFKVIDRRRRGDEEPVRPAEPLREPAPAPRSAPPPAPADPGRSLVGLFMMLGGSALMVDVLALLREKTEGHRSGEETQVLEDLLYDLQLRYVSATKHPG